MTDNDQLCADLRTAKEILAKGRCIGAMIRGDTACILGAIGLATFPQFQEAMTLHTLGIMMMMNPRTAQAINAIYEHLPEELQYLYEGQQLPLRIKSTFIAVSHYNDYTATDKDVQTLFEKTLADLGGL